ALGFVTGLQHLPPRQRTVLVLRDVLGFHAAEVAEMIETSEASVNSALQRARGALEARATADRERVPLPHSPRERDLVSRFAEAFTRDEIDTVLTMLTDEAMLTMRTEPRDYRVAPMIRSRHRAV